MNIYEAKHMPTYDLIVPYLGEMTELENSQML